MVLTAAASVASTTAAFATLAANFMGETAGTCNQNKEASQSNIDIGPERVISIHVVGLVSDVGKYTSINTEAGDGEWHCLVVVNWVQLLEFHADQKREENSQNQGEKGNEPDVSTGGVALK